MISLIIPKSHYIKGLITTYISIWVIGEESYIHNHLLSSTTFFLLYEHVSCFWILYILKPHIFVLYIYIYIWLCLFFRCADFSKCGKFEFCEPYPRIIPRTIPRIIPANHDYECFFWDRLGLHGLTSFNGRDKPIDKCWPDPMIPGCLHIPSRHEWWGWLAG